MSTASAMSIGITIKNLRRQRDMTQEQLAEYLGITSRAVSQWECGRTAPDITQLPLLANIFEVSADVLLGIDVDAKEKRIAAVIEEAASLASKGYSKEASALLRPKLQEYPDNCRLMAALMNALFFEQLNLESDTKKEMNLEMIRLGEKILETCTDDSIRHAAVQTLCMIYPETGETDKALALAEKMPDYNCDRDSLIRLIYSSAGMGEKRFEHIRHELHNAIFQLKVNLCCNNMVFEDGTRPYTREEMLLLNEKWFAIMDILFEDKNYGFYSCWLSHVHWEQAWTLAKLGRFPEAIQHLQTAADLAVEHDTRFNPEEGAYTCLLLRGQKYGSPYYSNSKNISMEMLEGIQDKLCDPIRETDAFVKLEARLKEAAKRREL